MGNMSRYATTADNPQARKGPVGPAACRAGTEGAPWPPSRKPPPPAPRPATPGPRRRPGAEKAKFTGRDKGANALIAWPGKARSPFLPEPPFPARGRFAPRKIRPARNGARRALTPKKGGPHRAGKAPPRECPRCHNPAPRALPNSPGKAGAAPDSARQPPCTLQAGPGQPRDRPSRRCQGFLYSKTTSLAGTGCLVGLRSKTIDHTRSASMVNPSSTTTHQTPKIKVKRKSQSQDQSQSQNHQWPALSAKVQVKPGPGTAPGPRKNRAAPDTAPAGNSQR